MREKEVTDGETYHGMIQVRPSEQNNRLISSTCGTDGRFNRIGLGDGGGEDEDDVRIEVRRWFAGWTTAFRLEVGEEGVGQHDKRCPLRAGELRSGVALGDGTGNTPYRKEVFLPVIFSFLERSGYRSRSRFWRGGLRDLLPPSPLPESLRSLPESRSR